jgi:hypothetical protein
VTLRTSDIMSDKFNISEYVTFFTKLKITVKYDKCSRAIRLQSCELVSRRLFLLGTPCINMSKCSYCWCFLCILRKIGFNPRSVHVGLWWTKWQWGRTFPRVFRFFSPLVCIIPHYSFFCHRGCIKLATMVITSTL